MACSGVGISEPAEIIRKSRLGGSNNCAVMQRVGERCIITFDIGLVNETGRFGNISDYLQRFGFSSRNVYIMYDQALNQVRITGRVPPAPVSNWERSRLQVVRSMDRSVFISFKFLNNPYDEHLTAYYDVEPSGDIVISMAPANVVQMSRLSRHVVPRSKNGVSLEDYLPLEERGPLPAVNSDRIGTPHIEAGTPAIRKEAKEKNMQDQDITKTPAVQRELIASDWDVKEETIKEVPFGNLVIQLCESETNEGRDLYKIIFEGADGKFAFIESGRRIDIKVGGRGIRLSVAGEDSKDYSKVAATKDGLLLRKYNSNKESYNKLRSLGIGKEAVRFPTFLGTDRHGEYIIGLIPGADKASSDPVNPWRGRKELEPGLANIRVSRHPGSKGFSINLRKSEIGELTDVFSQNAKMFIFLDGEDVVITAFHPDDVENVKSYTWKDNTHSFSFNPGSSGGNEFFGVVKGKQRIVGRVEKDRIVFRKDGQPASIIDGDETDTTMEGSASAAVEHFEKTSTPEADVYRGRPKSRDMNLVHLTTRVTESVRDFYKREAAMRGISNIDIHTKAIEQFLQGEPHRDQDIKWVTPSSTSSRRGRDQGMVQLNLYVDPSLAEVVRLDAEKHGVTEAVYLYTALTHSVAFMAGSGGKPVVQHIAGTPVINIALTGEAADIIRRISVITGLDDMSNLAQKVNDFVVNEYRPIFENIRNLAKDTAEREAHVAKLEAEAREERERLERDKSSLLNIIGASV